MKMIFLAFTNQIAANINLNCPSSVVYRKVEFLSQPSGKFSGYFAAKRRRKSIFALKLAVFSPAIRRRKDRDARRKNSENTAI